MDLEEFNLIYDEDMLKKNPKNRQEFSKKKRKSKRTKLKILDNLT